MPIRYYTQDCEFIYKGKGKTSEWIRETVRQESRTLGAVSIVFCSDDHLLEINRRYLKHDYYTDIITFDYGDAEKGKIAGDLMIGIGTVEENAKKYGVNFDNELRRVIIHGILHLCGYGDKSPEEEKKMRALEDKYLVLIERPTVDPAK